MSAIPVRRSGATAPSRHERSDERAHLVVVEAEAQRRSVIGRVGVSLLCLLFGAVFGLVVFQSLLVQSQRELDDLRREVSEQEHAAKSLRLDLASAAAPDRIAEAARERLGMVPPGDVGFLEPQSSDDRNAAFDPATETTVSTSTSGVGTAAGATDDAAGAGTATTATTWWSPPSTTATTVYRAPTTTAKAAPTTTYRPPTTVTTTTRSPTTTTARGGPSTFPPPTTVGR